MPAGQVIIKQFIDGADGPQNIAYWSDDGTPTGNLSPIVQATDAVFVADTVIRAAPANRGA